MPCLQVLTEAYEYITQVPGKEVRTLLINAFNVWMDVPADKVSKGVDESDESDDEYIEHC